MILGLSIEPGHECTCTTEEEVHLSLASIESRSCCGEAGSFSQLMLKTANSEQLLCTFVHGVIFQQCLDLKLMPGEKVTFTVQGSYRVYVTGYSCSSDSNPLVPAVNEPTVEEDTDGDDYNNNNTQVKSEPDDSEYFNDVSRDGEMMSNEKEELNDRQGESNTQIKSEPEDSDDSNNCDWDEEMTNSSHFEAANDSQEDEDFVVSEEIVTSKNLHEVAGASTGGPVLLTEEEVFQQMLVDVVKVTDNGIEGSIDNNGTTYSKPTSTSTMRLKKVGSLGLDELKENDLIGDMVEDNKGKNNNDIPLLRQDHTPGVTKAEKGHLCDEESTPAQVVLNDENQSNLDSGPSVDISCILPREPPIQEIQETASPHHETWEDKTNSDCARSEFMGTHGKEKQEDVTTGLKLFLCKHCVKSFSTAPDLEQHEHTHSNEQPFSCKQCGKVLLKKESLLEHEMIHKQEKPFVCKYCEEKFTSRSTLWRHKKLHMVENPFHCNDCDKKFNSRQALKEHEKVHAREKTFNEQTTFSCMYCKKEFGDKADWLEHEKTHTSKKLHKKFSQQRALSLHEKKPTGPRNFKCSHCEKSFSRNRELAHHEMIHTGEKPFQCNQCEKSFNRSTTLKTHMKIHTGEKSFQCCYCGEAFRHKFTLVHHERIHKNLKPYNCKYCNKTFNAKSTLKCHEWVHSEEKPFQCKHCDKTFSRKQTLARHERIHTGEKPYECKECEKRFNQRVALIRHQRVHTGDMPYKCKYCDKKFAWSSNYLNHERTHTKEGAS